MDVLGCDESTGVSAGVGDQFREERRKDEEEERQIALHPLDHWTSIQPTVVVAYPWCPNLIGDV